MLRFIKNSYDGFRTDSLLQRDKVSSSIMGDTTGSEHAYSSTEIGVRGSSSSCLTDAGVARNHLIHGFALNKPSSSSSTLFIGLFHRCKVIIRFFRLSFSSSAKNSASRVQGLPCRCT
jgi:hypothetical protein